MQNPNTQYVPSTGADLPIMHVYLAGRIAGNCIEKCIGWRKKLSDHYKNYNGKGVYPISFLDPLNSGEAKSVDKLGLKSDIPPNLIYDKDLLSVQRADIVVANMDDYMEEGIQRIGEDFYEESTKEEIYQEWLKLYQLILNRRPNWGTDCEVSWALYLKKPLILIADRPILKGMLEQHPFMKRASVIVSSVDELIERKLLNLLYKSISGSTY